MVCWILGHQCNNWNNSQFDRLKPNVASPGIQRDFRNTHYAIDRIHTSNPPFIFEVDGQTVSASVWLGHCVDRMPCCPCHGPAGQGLYVQRLFAHGLRCQCGLARRELVTYSKFTNCPPQLRMGCLRVEKHTIRRSNSFFGRTSGDRLCQMGKYGLSVKISNAISNEFAWNPTKSNN